MDFGKYDSAIALIRPLYIEAYIWRHRAKQALDKCTPGTDSCNRCAMTYEYYHGEVQSLFAAMFRLGVSMDEMQILENYIKTTKNYKAKTW